MQSNLSEFRAALVFAVLSLAAIYWRLIHGIMITDEAHVVGMSYSMCLGNLPYFDEMIIPQNVAILLVPLTKIFLWVRGSDDGIILFFRHVYLVGSLSIGYVVYLLFKKIISNSQALLLSSFLICFVPLSVPETSFYTFSMWSFMAGLCTVGFAYLGRHSSPRIFLAILFFGVAAFGYPPVAPASLLAIYGGFWLLRKNEKSRLAFILALAVLLGLMALYVYLARPENILRMIAYHKALGVQGGGTIKLKQIAKALYQRLPYALGIICFFGSFWYLPRRFGKWSPYLAVFLIPTFAFTFKLVDFPNMVLTYCAYLSGFIVYSSKIRLNKNIRILKYFWIASVVAGSCLSWASTNGILAASTAMTLAALAGFCGLFLMCENIGDLHRENLTVLRYRRFLVTCLFLFLCILQIKRYFVEPYWDGDVSQLSTRQTGAGGFNGIFTNAITAEYLTTLTSDISRERGAAKTVLFFDNFPAGYLLSDLKPSAPTLWFFQSGGWLNYDRRILGDYYSDKTKLPDLVVHMKKTPLNNNYMKLDENHLDPIMEIFSDRSGYARIFENSRYEMYFHIK